MYAIVKTGGKQYRVKEGDKLRVERLPAEVGAKLELDQVLLFGDGETIEVGVPFVTGVVVEATVQSLGREKKLRSLSFGVAKILG